MGHGRTHEVGSQRFAGDAGWFMGMGWRLGNAGKAGRVWQAQWNRGIGKVWKMVDFFPGARIFFRWTMSGCGMVWEWPAGGGSGNAEPQLGENPLTAAT